MKQNFSARTTALDDALGVGRCFDMTARDLTIGGRRARLWVVNGYAQESVLERIIAQWLAAPDLADMKTPDAFLRRFVTACDAAVCLKKEAAVLGVFSGKTLLVVDGWDGGILMDVKQFPTRSIEEPDTSRVLRGSHDGFVENLMQNAALLRRRIRDSRLTLERVQLDNRSHTDVVLCYMDGEADPDLLAEIRKKLENMQVGSIAMSQESVAEALSPRQFWNPFPKVRYTERPDVATACIMEGDVVVMVDNCYGEFVETMEPSDVGADMVVGSLIKNPGGGLAPIGGYICGTAECVERCAYRLSAPGLGQEVGANLGLLPSLYEGFFLAPNVVSGALKGAIFAANVYERLGFRVVPNGTESRHDIIQAVELGSAEGMLAFCRGIQAAAPVDSYVTPVPWAMPGYDAEVVMAAGAFVQGSSIELSADGPIREPYAVYFQGGLTWYHAKLGILMSLQKLVDAGLAKLPE